MISWKAVIFLLTNIKSNTNIFYDISHRYKNVTVVKTKESPQKLSAVLIFLRLKSVVGLRNSFDANWYTNQCVVPMQVK
jgi:hypothetical protein